MPARTDKGAANYLQCELFAQKTNFLLAIAAIVGYVIYNFGIKKEIFDMQKKNAFTLIELLVVIAIIALLLAIITPSLQLAKEKAQFILCKVNLRSYGLAMKLYLNENDDDYPECTTSMFDGSYTGYGFSIPIRCQWHDKRISPQTNPLFAGPLWPYMDNQKAHMCPTFKKFAKVHGADHDNHDASVPIEPTYAYSQNAFLGTIDGKRYGVRKETQVLNPAETLVWVEETIWTIPDWAGWVLNDTAFFSRHCEDSSRPQWGDFIATYHKTSIAKPNDGEGNAVFVDGHVELLDPYYTVDLADGKQARAGFIYSWPLRGRLSPTIPY